MARQTNRHRGIVCVATEQGLGRQAKSFIDNGLIDEVFCVPHSSYVNHYDWYPNRCQTYDELLNKVTEIWFLETPYDWNFILRARERKIKTVLFLMYECSALHYIPDVLVGGSMMEREYFGDRVKVINVPVDVKWKKRTKAKVFIHNAGHLGIHGRNGTNELIAAIPHIKSDIKLIIRSQVPLREYKDPRVEYQIGDFPYEELFNEGDVFVYPDKFGGSCLPLQEAHASGMLVMASNRHPSNLWLPNEPLIPTDGYKKDQIVGIIDSAIVNPLTIARTIDYWFEKDITKYSLLGKKWAKENSWAKLKPEYEKI
jgi:hypothetical protein